MTDLSRRAFLGSTAALAASAAAAPALAQTVAPGTRFSSVAVDVGPLHARRLGDYAEFIRRRLTTELQRAFADRLGGRGRASSSW